MSTKVIKARMREKPHTNTFPDWAEAPPGMEPYTHARPSPAQVLEATASIAGNQPPAAMAKTDALTTLNLRVRQSTLDAVAAEAKARGLTLKQVLCLALVEAGLEIAPADKEDRTPRRKHRSIA